MSDSRPPTEIDELRAELAHLRAEVAELRAERSSPRGPAPSEPSGPTSPATPIDRRAAIRRAGILAAGAVAGGAALATASASPAAAATVAGSGNPGVTATGVSGDGLVATTNTANKAAVRATTSTAGANAANIVHSGQGTGLNVAGAATEQSGIPAMKVTATGGGLALSVASAVSDAARFDGRVAFAGSRVDHLVTISNTERNGKGLEIAGEGRHTTAITVRDALVGLEVTEASTGAVIEATGTGLKLDAGSTHLALDPIIGGPIPPTRFAAGRRGDLVMHENDLWLCVVQGVPGTWRRLAGERAAGALEVLDVPGRAYDSRPGTKPAVGSKTKLAPNVARVVDLTGGGTVPIPPDATAAVLTLLLVNAATGAGNLTVWANGAAKPLANTMVWGGDAGRFTATAVARLDVAGKVQVEASLATNIVVDVVGFHR